MDKKEKLLKILELNNFTEEIKQYLKHWEQIIKEFAATVQAGQEDAIFFNPDELNNIVSVEEFLEIIVRCLEKELNEEEIDWLISVFEHPLSSLFNEKYPDLLDKAIDISTGQLEEKTEQKLVELGIILSFSEDKDGLDDIDLDDSIT